MALSQNLTTFQPALKTLYPDKVVQDLVYKDQPFFALVPKFEKFYGENLKQPLIYGNPQGRSATFATAQTNQAPSSLKAFFLTRVQDYALASIDNETLKASESNEGAFLEAFSLEMDGALHSLSRSIGISLYRSGSGSIGQLATTNFAQTVWTLTNAEDITNFEVNQAVVLSATNGGGTVKAGLGYIVTINRDDGTFTASATIGGAAANIVTLIPTVATGDWIFIQGDYDKKAKGLDAWLPATLQPGDNFFGVNRNADKTRLAGQYLDQTNVPIEEALINLTTRVNREGGTPDYIFLDYLLWSDLEKALGARVQYVDVKTNYDVAWAFRGINLNTPKGYVKVIADINAVPGFAYAIQMNTWRLASLGKAPTLFDTDGLTMLRQSAADGVELRMYSYHQLGCGAPGWNGRCKLR